MSDDKSCYNDNILYNITYTHDKLGRITDKKEMVVGVTTTYHYEYDLAGRLILVKVNDTVTEYRYDDNGNRTHINNVEVASYDDQDRLLQYQNQSYTHTANGEWLTKVQNGQTTRYTYDVLTNLTKVFSFPCATWECRYTAPAVRVKGINFDIPAIP